MARHADATEVVVSAVIKGDQLHLIISDNGRGSSQPTNRTPGRGLPGMAERARLLGGALTTVSTADGFTVDARLPTQLPA